MLEHPARLEKILLTAMPTECTSETGSLGISNDHCEKIAFSECPSVFASCSND